MFLYAFLFCKYFLKWFFYFIMFLPFLIIARWFSFTLNTWVLNIFQYLLYIVIILRSYIYILNIIILLSLLKNLYIVWSFIFNIYNIYFFNTVCRKSFINSIQFNSLAFESLHSCAFSHSLPLSFAVIKIFLSTIFLFLSNFVYYLSFFPTLLCISFTLTLCFCLHILNL